METYSNFWFIQPWWETIDYMFRRMQKLHLKSIIKMKRTLSASLGPYRRLLRAAVFWARADCRVEIWEPL